MILPMTLTLVDDSTHDFETMTSGDDSTHDCEALRLGSWDFAVGTVLGQRIDGKFKPIYYASKTLYNAQEHYTTTEK
nr:putative reverse transcriptase domain-containing protein [Tanacetum cinerariifolium]